jgi:hypothetical protein
MPSLCEFRNDLCKGDLLSLYLNHLPREQRKTVVEHEVVFSRHEMRWSDLCRGDLAAVEGSVGRMSVPEVVKPSSSRMRHTMSFPVSPVTMKCPLIEIPVAPAGTPNV